MRDDFEVQLSRFVPIPTPAEVDSVAVAKTTIEAVVDGGVIESSVLVRDHIDSAVAAERSVSSLHVSPCVPDVVVHPVDFAIHALAEIDGDVIVEGNTMYGRSVGPNEVANAFGRVRGLQNTDCGEAGGDHSVIMTPAASRYNSGSQWQPSS